MAKANLTLPNGTKVAIEGASAEVALLLKTFSEPVKQSRSAAKTAAKSGLKGARRTRKGPVVYITELADAGFFKERKRLADVQNKLEEGGHIYAQTSLSPALLKLTKKKILRRVKDSKTKRWVYVHS